jgi:predicted porin
MMQKKVFALALAAGLVAPLSAFADSANVNFYGVLDADVEHVRNSLPGTATFPTSRNRVTSNASRFGLKGSDDLGNGLEGIFQIESRVNLAGNETAAGTSATGGATSTNVGVFNGVRNSNLGLKGNFGTVFVGNWDTPFKTAHNPVELFDNSSIATATALMGNTTATVAASGAISSSVNYTLRQNSSIQYWTPVMGGLQGKLAYSTNNTTVGTVATATATTQNPSLISLSAVYDVEQFYAAFAYDRHSNFRTVTVGAVATAVSDSAIRLVGAYKFGDGQVGLAYDRMTVASQAVTAGVTADATRGAWELSGKYKFGASYVGAFYTKAGNVGSAVSSGAKQVSLRYGYNFSKRTEAYGMYTSIKNGVNASYGIVDVANGYTVAAGSKISGFGVGLRHTF